MRPRKTWFCHSILLSQVISIGILSFFDAAVHADWPQFRGPNGNGLAKESSPPIKFGPGINELWHLELDSGHSSPVVVGDQVFVTTYRNETKQLNVVAVDRHQGTINWQLEIAAKEIERGHPSFNPASSTPVADRERVVAYFGSFGLVCSDHDGNKQWELPLPLTKSYAGNAISPVMVGDKVILYRGNYVDHFLLAVNKYTGKEIWRTEQSEPFHPELACTAVPVVHGKQLILHGARSVQGFDLQSGDQLWVTKCATTATSTPLVVNDRVIVAAWNKMGEPALRPEFPTFQDLIDANDRNADQVIDASEFPKLWIFHRPEGAEAPQNGAAIPFKRVDADSDGFLSKDEWEVQLRNLDRFRQGYQNHGLLSLPTDRRGVLADKDVMTLETQGIPEVPSPICDGRFVYLVKNGGQVTCIDLQTKERIFRKRTGGRGTHYASPVIAGDHLYIADGRGQIVVMTLGRSSKVVAKNQMSDRVYATPAVVGDTLLVRTHTALYAFSNKAE